MTSAKTKFLVLFRLMPGPMRRMIAYYWEKNPMTLEVVALEIQNDTKSGKKILKQLGFKND